MRTLLALAMFAGCHSSPAPVTGAPVNQAPPTERPQLTTTECEAQGGKVIGDIGDGAIHRPDYRCESGAPPVGTIAPAAGGPVAVEGSVCCK